MAGQITDSLETIASEAAGKLEKLFFLSEAYLKEFYETVEKANEKGLLQNIFNHKYTLHLFFKKNGNELISKGLNKLIAIYFLGLDEGILDDRHLDYFTQQEKSISSINTKEATFSKSDDELSYAEISSFVHLHHASQKGVYLYRNLIKILKAQSLDDKIKSLNQNVDSGTEIRKGMVSHTNISPANLKKHSPIQNLYKDIQTIADYLESARRLISANLLQNIDSFPLIKKNRENAILAAYSYILFSDFGLISRDNKVYRAIINTFEDVGNNQNFNIKETNMFQEEFSVDTYYVNMEGTITSRMIECSKNLFNYLENLSETSEITEKDKGLLKTYLLVFGSFMNAPINRLVRHYSKDHKRILNHYEFISSPEKNIFTEYSPDLLLPLASFAPSKIKLVTEESYLNKLDNTLRKLIFN